MHPQEILCLIFFHNDYYFLDYAVKWLAINLDIKFEHWNGGGGNNGLYHSLNPNQNLDIWITEYDFEPENGKREWVGTWPHALGFLYNTLRYMDEVPNIELLPPNNLIGYAGSYRLLDTYSCAEGVCNPGFATSPTRGQHFEVTIRLKTAGTF